MWTVVDWQSTADSWVIVLHRSLSSSRTLLSIRSLGIFLILSRLGTGIMSRASLRLELWPTNFLDETLVYVSEIHVYVSETHVYVSETYAYDPETHVYVQVQTFSRSKIVRRIKHFRDHKFSGSTIPGIKSYQDQNISGSNIIGIKSSGINNYRDQK